MRAAVPVPSFPLFITGVAISSMLPEGARLHTHSSGQLYCLTKGLAVVEDALGLLAVPPRQIGWLPPETPHRACPHGEISGWAAYIAPELCAGLPSQACVLQCSEFIPLIMERLLACQESGEMTPGSLPEERQKRMVDVFLDELASSRPMAQRLPFPQDARLVRITQALLENPGDTRTMAEWGIRVGMSERGIARHFLKETGMSLAQWRRMNRLWRARELLAQGVSVQETAWSLGYENVSAFIGTFKEVFLQTPAQYASGLL
jgi:AraC-like DNA-binding protein